ncbi:MAG: CapA family protein [Candidatus Cloacimonadaceae bacterium]|jgi:poly-gamma-glutamate capsule biosynthesis protein CapA/YwtB (metallophosphatase superfamily)|nr:CapA family protein [Candidatus Cloacimonadota bacterium]MDD4559985.1 CapA family protein [Candidatus Cloacimonadota bacterium]
MRIVLLGLLLFALITPIMGQTGGEVIEDFESGIVQLDSWLDEDLQPSAWILDTQNTHASSQYSLKLTGNTWKQQSITPFPTQHNTVIEFWAYHISQGTVRGLGFSDGENQLFYSIDGSRILDLEQWVPVYQGSKPSGSWNHYCLPLGSDWESFFGYFPQITSIIYVNDLDQNPTNSVWFDSLINISDTLPIAPQVSISTNIPAKINHRYVGIQFSAQIIDPDSDVFSYYWSFGDSLYSNEASPYHVFDVLDAHQYTVNLIVTDDTGKRGFAATQINPDPGPSSLPLTLNFVGDVMLARRYDSQIIPYYGIDYIFSPTYSMLGGAADVSIANLEVVLANTGSPHPTKSVVYRGNPSNMQGLVVAGIENVCLANNHTLDYGLPALNQTRALLEANGIGFSGAGANSYEAYLPSFIHQKGISIALLRSSDRTGQYNNAQPYLHAGFDKEGFAYMTPYYNALQIQAVDGIADLKIIEMHSGSEYSTCPGEDYGKSNPFLGDIQDEDYSYRSDVPRQWDREIRQSAIDNGADLVIVHHPHIVHGMELYNGKVIAHSLGNFVFDLDYPECMNSAILYVDAYPDGFKNHYLRPVFIDGYIPKPATGQLGIHILDYIAMKSRELDTIVVVDKEELKASVPLVPEALNAVSHTFLLDTPLVHREGGSQYTAPHKLPRYGSISSVDYPGPAQDTQIRLGRELVWFGDFEDAGCNLWDVAEYSDIAMDGARSASFSGTTTSAQTATISQKMKIYDPLKSFTLHGWIFTQNAQSANITVRFYNNRTAYSPIHSEDITTNVSGNMPWKYFYKDLVVPANAWYFDIRLSFTGTGNSRSKAWFDNVGLIQWEDWLPHEQTQIMYPNDFYWFQLRTAEGVKSISCNILETSLSPARERHGNSNPPSALPVTVYPNPFRAETTICIETTAKSPISVKIYNIKGQLVRSLQDDVPGYSKHSLTWDSKDSNGQSVASGLYFFKVRCGERVSMRKAILLK